MGEAGRLLFLATPSSAVLYTPPKQERQGLEGGDFSKEKYDPSLDAPKLPLLLVAQ